MNKPTTINPAILLGAILTTALSALPLAGQSADRVRLVDGSLQRGNIEKVTADEISLDKGTRTESISVGMVRDIRFQGEPTELTQARLQYQLGNYKQALQSLEEISAPSVSRKEITADMEYYRSAAQARIAIGTKAELRDAGRAVQGFASQNPDSYHYYSALELMGDVLVAMDDFDKAAQQYALLSRSQSPEIQLRAQILRGQALMAQGDYQAALTEFDSVLRDASGQDGDRQIQRAQMGRARCLAHTNRADEAIDLATKIIEETAPEETSLQAEAHLALGHCYLGAGQKMDALLAFLYIDVLCRTEPAAHAEALYHLIPLYAEIGREDQARAARNMLEEQYPQDAWTQKLLN